MADFPAAVTDTHPLIFHAAGGKKLGKRAALHFAACERREAILYVPVVVLWELSLLVRVGRVPMEGTFSAFCDTLFSNPAYQPLDVNVEQVCLAHNRTPNNDPFDGLICAAAASAALPLVTRDAAIVDSGIVRVLW
jgi:PIN domain nuclease of toxin-antitoxin system